MLQPGEPVILMGPTGTPTEIPRGETVVLCGGGLGNAVLFSIGARSAPRAPRSSTSPATRRCSDRYKVEEIESAADVVVWCCDEAPGFTPRRPQDRSFVGNIVQAMDAYAAGRARRARDPAGGRRPHHRHRLGPHDGGGRRARGTTCSQQHLKPGHVAIGSINSPMQCMMKEICAQCLQPHVDPQTGEDELRLLLLQPGPAARPGGLQGAERPPEAEFPCRETDGEMARALHARAQKAAYIRLAPPTDRRCSTNSANRRARCSRAGPRTCKKALASAW